METKRNSKPGGIRHVPRRTCIACRRVQDKKELVRLVSSADGTTEADATWKKPGRGAYLCRDIRCWEEGLKGNRLNHALKTGITRENRAGLLEWIKDYLETDKQSGVH